MTEVIPKCAEIAKVYRRESVLYGENLSYSLEACKWTEVLNKNFGKYGNISV